MTEALIQVSHGGSALTAKSGAEIKAEPGASVTLTYTAADDATLFKATNGTQDWPFYFGNDLRTHAASPGALYFRSDGSMSLLYMNISDGSTGSNWAAACINRP